MKIKLMADSTCDLSIEILEQYEISIAPLIVTIDGQEFRDRMDIETDEFYNKLATYKNPPTTSMPSPESFITCIREADEQGYEVVLCICMSSGTSGSYQGAVLAKDLYYEKYPESKIRYEVIDSVAMSHGSGWLIMKCAMLRDKGYTFEQLIEYCQAIKYRIKHYLSVDDLDNLIRSGRLSNTSAMIGKMLSIKPIMSMKNTKGAIIAKKRGYKQVLNYYIEEFIKRVDYDQTNFVIIGYTSDMHKAENLKAKFITETGFKGDIFIMQMGVAVGTHVGLGGLSMFFVEKAHEDFIHHVKEIIMHRIHK
ncbi:MAG: DegV family protein [Firmicutes bacterium HGW-Firmicutes-1]|nr:MAG: DegV family protein [Firmicutes bacterium HGW-Firmicutes-1]